MKHHTHQVQRRPYITYNKQMWYLLWTQNYFLAKGWQYSFPIAQRYSCLIKKRVIFSVSELLSKSGVIHKLIINEMISICCACFLLGRVTRSESLGQLLPLVVAKEIFFPLSEDHWNEPSSSHPFSHWAFTNISARISQSPLLLSHEA